MPPDARPFPALRLALLLLVALAPAACRPAGERSQPAAGGAPPASGVAPDVAETLALFNRGAALMEQYRYAEAADCFRRVAERFPDWTAAKFNLGLALFNMHGLQNARDNLAAARDTFQQVLAADPQHVPARFCLGLYYQYAGEVEQALACFDQVRAADPDDPYAAYKYAEVLLAAGRTEQATDVLEQIVQRHPGFVSAVYRLALQYQRRGERKRAMELFQRFRQLQGRELTGGRFTVQAVYGMAGKYSLVLGPDQLPLAPPTPPPPAIPFDPQIREIRLGQGPLGPADAGRRPPGLAVADVDRDGDLDACVTGAGEDAAAVLLVNDGRGGFSCSAALADRAISPCFGDLDNDGDVDLWLGRDGPDLALLNDGQGRFRPAPWSGQTGGPDAPTVLARLADLDSDGDLDLLAFRRGAASSVWINHRDGTWADQAETYGLTLAGVWLAGVVYDDLDDDRDLDLLLLPAAGPPRAWANDRAGAYRILDAAAMGLPGEGCLGAVAGDADKDGDRDLLLLTAGGLRWRRNEGSWRFAADERFQRQFGSLGGSGAQLADLDNDGDLDLLLPDAQRGGVRRPALLANLWPEPGWADVSSEAAGHVFSSLKLDGPTSGVAADFDADGRCDALLAPAGGSPLLLRNASPPRHWIELDLTGVRPQDNKARSPATPIGARVEVKTGRVFQQYVVGEAAGANALAPLRIHAGLGEHAQVDWLRIIWPDAVLQAELEAPADRVAAIAQLPRKTSSCPYLFAWDGQRFRFVSDFGGVGGLGYLAAPGQYARPDPSECVPLGPLAPRDGFYELRCVTPLEEVTYFDQASLLVADHPAGTVVLPNEMMAVAAPPPEAELFCIAAAEKLRPERAVDERGRDVTDRLVRVDRRCAGANEPDPRFVGYAAPHSVTLDFGDRLAAWPAGRRIVLFLHGWVEYPYSSTNFAAAQAGLRLEAPTIDVQRGGRWVVLAREAGYPAGVNHTMTLELTGKLRPGDRRLRIRTNMQVYWDEVFLASPLADGRMEVRELAPASAELRFFGYPREYSPDGLDPPLCDYRSVESSAGWKLMPGRYTRYGEVAELLEAADDCFVIMGHGEQLTLRFPAASLPPLQPGRRRSFLLMTHSYCKDMDLHTAHGDAVEPLPFRAMSGYPYGPDEAYPDTPRTRRYRQLYNTRVMGLH